jgi:hypothetical protein
LSAVVASFSDGAILDRCLEALTARIGSGDAEILVVRDAGRTDGFDRSAAARRFPQVRFIDAPPGTTVPRLRTIGIAASRGEAVALLEDDCVVTSGWSEAAASVLATPHAAIAGAVEPGDYTRQRDWAVYFCEYARFMNPLPASGDAPLPGNNAAYKRSALEQLPADARDGFQEVFVQAHWRAAGLTTGASEALVVHNINSWPARQLTAVPFHHARAYAARRFDGRPLAARLPFALLTIALPLVKAARLAAETSSRGRLLGRLITAMPWVLLFTTSWSLGEAVGSLAGAGRSAAEWR